MEENSDLNLDSNSDMSNLSTHQDSTRACKKKKMENQGTEEKDNKSSNNDDIQETVSAIDMAKINAPHALIWHFFTKMEVGQYKATCNICKIVRSIPTSITTTLQNHLKRHVTAYNEYLRLKQLKESKTVTKNKLKENSNRQMSLKRNLIRTMAYDPSSKRAQEITKAIAIFICKGLHAYNIVEEPAFKDLIFLLEPKFVVSCRTTFSRSVIPKIYEELKDEMLKRIDFAKATLYAICMTTDLWTSRSGDSYVAFTLQFLDENFVMQYMIIDCQPFPGKHDAAAIYKKVEDIIFELDLCDERIRKYILSDNGTNMVKALSKSNDPVCNLNDDLIYNFDMDETVTNPGNISWEHILCYNHTLQLTISNTRKEMNASSVIEKVSSIVGRYNRSKSARESLEHFQYEHKIPKHDLIQMVCTRWDSEFLMLERILEQKPAIISEHIKAGINNLTAQEWKLIEGYVEILRPIATFTAEMGSRTKPTLSMVLPVLFEIKSSLEDIIKKGSKKIGIMFARKLLANIKQRFPDSKYWDLPLYRTAMLLDPRFKDALLSKKDSISLLKEKAIENLRENIITSECQASISIQSSQAEVFSKQSKWDHLRRKTHIRNMNIPTEEIKITIEVENYLKLPIIGEQDDPLAWWKENASQFPSLGLLARHYLAIAATETSSERVFSVGGNVVTNKRTNLLADNVRQLIFCHDNLSALDYPRFGKR